MLQMAATPVLGRLRQEECKFEARVGCMHRKFWFQTKQNKQNQEAVGMALRIKAPAAKGAETHKVEGETHT